MSGFGLPAGVEDWSSPCRALLALRSCAPTEDLVLSRIGYWTFSEAMGYSQARSIGG